MLEPGHRPKSKSRRVYADEPEIQAPKQKMMKAAEINEFGPPSVLKLQELPAPQAEANEVLIALYASGVGVWDADIRGGWWPKDMDPPRFPLVLGSDGAGVIAEVGAEVKDFHTGDRVWAYEFINPKGGFYAEFVAVKAEHVGLIPGTQF